MVGGDKLIDETAKTNQGRDPFPLLEFEIWLTGAGIEDLQTEMPRCFRNMLSKKNRAMW